MKMLKKSRKDEKEDKKIKEELDFNKPDYIFTPKGAHNYRQEGFYLVCRSCDLVHAVFIGPDRVLVGLENGEPILKKRKEIV